MKILWIDPLNTNPQFLNLLAIILRQAGHQVVVHANARAGFLPPAGIAWSSFSRMPTVPASLKANLAAGLRLSATYPFDWLRAVRHAGRIEPDGLLLSTNLMLPRFDAWGLRLLQRRGLRPVVVVHKPYQTLYDDQQGDRAHRYRDFYQRAPGLLTMTRHTRDILQTFYGLPDGRLHHCAHPHFQPLLDCFDLDQGQLQRLRDWAGDDPVIAFLSNMRPEQGLDDLLAALPQLVDRLSAWRLLLVSPSPRRDTTEAVERRLVELGLEGRYWCQWERYSYPALKAYLETATMVVAPYKWATQSGVIALATGAGLPVVTTAVGGLPEMVEPGVNGELVPPADPPALTRAIVQIVDRIDHYCRGARASRTGQYDPGRAAAAFVDALQAASQQPHLPRP